MAPRWGAIVDSAAGAAIAVRVSADAGIQRLVRRMATLRPSEFAPPHVPFRRQSARSLTSQSTKTRTLLLRWRFDG